MSVVSREIAEQEVGKWLDFKRVSERRRKDLADTIDALVDAVEDGSLTLEEGMKFKQTLKFPIKTNDTETAELTFKPRITVGEVQTKLKGVKATDTDERLNAYMSALTGQPMGVIKALDTDDQRTGLAIAVFFL
jgi:polyhydroxyalkanoate synthesis regulator phasin